jgi:hypothetical protein
VSYNLLAESTGQLNWEEVHRRLVPFTGEIQVFPVCAREPEERDCVGIAIHQRSVDKRAWRKLTSLIEVLEEEFGMEVVELYSGEMVAQKNLKQVRQRFLRR